MLFYQLTITLQIMFLNKNNTLPCLCPKEMQENEPYHPN
jgi:hypothetical protein